MKTVEYLETCNAIHAELAQLAERSKEIAWARSAYPSNPAWASLSSRQEELLGWLAALDRVPLEP